MGGRGGGRGGPDWQGRPNAMAFGNGRRDPRTMYNGNASFSLDNSIWDARTYSVTGAAVNKPAYANGRGSIMFGGPLRIPKLVSAGKRIMFTFDYQAQRNRTGTISDPVNMPTALERIGDFSQSTVKARRSSFTIPRPARHSRAIRFRRIASAPHRRRCCSIFRIPTCHLPRATIRRRGADGTTPRTSIPASPISSSETRTRSTSASAIRAAAVFRRTCSSSSTPAPGAESTPTWRGRGRSPRVSSITCATPSAAAASSRRRISPIARTWRRNSASPALRRMPQTGGRPI